MNANLLPHLHSKSFSSNKKVDLQSLNTGRNYLFCVYNIDICL